MRKGAIFLLYLFFGAVAVFIFFRESVLSGFDALPGGQGDARLNLVILEHWFRVFQGLDEWRSPNFFYPVKGVLGYSDSLFLFALPYCLLRALDVDMFTAFLVVLMAACAVGYAGMVVLLRRFIGLPVAFSILGGFMFATANGAYLATSWSHPQLLAVWLLPMLSLPIIIYWRLRDKKNWLGWAAGIAFCLFYPALCYTSYYVGWFFLFFCFVGTAFAGIFYILKFGRQTLWEKCKGYLQAYAAQWGVFALMGLVAMAPFILTYLPVRIEMGSRPLSEPIMALPTLGDFVNVGSENLVWGRPYRAWFQKLDTRPYQNELQFGFPLLLLALFVGTTGISLRRLRKDSVERPIESAIRQRVYTCNLLGITVLTCWLLLFKTGGSSLWWLVHLLVPGAGGIRAPFRFNLILALPVIAVAMIGLTQIWEKIDRGASAFKKTGWLATMGLIFAVLAAEQINARTLSHFSRAENLALLKRVSPKPENAIAFFISPQNDSGKNWFELQTASMMIAQHIDLPTHNGLSGFFPKGWNLWDPREPDYQNSVADIILFLENPDKIHGLNLETGTWESSVDFLSFIPVYTPGDDLIFFKNDQPLKCAVQGWSAPESWGMWSEGWECKLLIRLEAIPSTDLILSANVISFTRETHPSQEINILANGSPVGKWVFTYGEPEKGRKLLIPMKVFREEPILKLNFEILNPQSPKNLGESEDPRLLGIGLKSLRIIKRVVD